MFKTEEIIGRYFDKTLSVFKSKKDLIAKSKKAVTEIHAAMIAKTAAVPETTVISSLKAP